MEKGGIPPTGVYTMKETPARPLPHIGLRNLKTALSASLCALIYFFLNRNPAFACIGAIFGMGADMDHSKLHGGNRLFGTVIGGFLGIGRPAEPERGGPLRAAAPTTPAPSGHSTRTAGPPPPGPRRG